MGLLSSLGSAAASAVGPLITTAGQLYTNYQNLKNQDYWNERQIELANTAHQRAVKDLEAAGLNPILAANSAASTPSLTSARLENPLSDFGRNSRELGKALIGMTGAELETAKADASTAKAYADNAKALAEAQMLEAQARAEIAANENWDSGNKRLNSTIEDWARHEALTGVRILDLGRYIEGDEGWKTYRNLVQMYRNEIESGRYTSSLGHALYDDIRFGVSSASDLVGAVKGIHGMLPKKPQRPQVERESHIIDRYNAKGEKVGSERRTRQRSRTR